MGFSLSPTVTVREFDKTLTVPGLATSIAAAVGHFQWGPVEQIELVDNEDTLVRKFGKPNDSHYADWFPTANFLAYSDNLKQVRAVRSVSTSFTDLTYTQTGGTIATVAGDFTADFEVGDQIVITGSVSNDGVYIVEAVATLLLTVVGDLPADEGTADAPGTITAGAWNAVAETIAIPVDGSELTEGLSVSIEPALVKNRDDLDQMASHVAQTAFYARCPGTYGNGITVSAFNGARNEQAGQTPSTEHWDAWDHKGLFAYAPTGDEIFIVVTYGNDVVETFEASQNINDVSPLGGTSYFVEKINRESTYIFAVPANDTSGISFQNNGTASKAYTGTKDSGFSITPVEFEMTLEKGFDSAPLMGDLQNAWALFNDPETEDVNFLLQGGAGPELGAWIIQNIAEVRLDCVACVSPSESDVVGVPSPEATVAALRDSGGALAYSSSYGIADGNYKYQYDKYNDTFRWVPFNGDIAGLMAETDRNRDPWWSPAGLNRGHIKNVNKVAFNPSKAQRDEIVKVGINAIAQFRGEGTVLYSDKTLQTKPSAFDHINVRRLFITLEKAIATAARYQLFEFNDEITRNNFLNLVEPYLRNVQGRRGVTGFNVVCDETNNTGEVIDRNEFVADIYIKPNRSINEIQLNFIAVKTDAQFEEVILAPNAS